MDQREEVGPRQLSHQRYDNLPVGEDFGELDHAAEVLFPKSASKLSLQLCTQCGHDLLPIVRPLFLEDVLPDALPDVPIERGKAGIHGPPDSPAGLPDPIPQVGQQYSWLLGEQDGRVRSRGWFILHHVWELQVSPERLSSLGL